MLLQPFGKDNRVQIAVCRRGILEGFVIFFLDVEFVEGIVDGFDVFGLDGDEVGFDEGDIIGFLKHADDAGMVDAGGEDGEEVCEEGGMLLEVKVEGFVVNLEIGRFDDDLFE
jgi:hypothetical protein